MAPPSPPAAERPTKDAGIVDAIVLHRGRPTASISDLPASKFLPSATDRAPWPSHSATRAHLPAHADLHVPRIEAPSPPTSARKHVPARLSIMPRSASGLVIATPTTGMSPLSALLAEGPRTGDVRARTLASEIEQAEGTEGSASADAPVEADLQGSPIESSEKSRNAGKDMPPPYSSSAHGVKSVRPAGVSVSHTTPIPLSVLSANRPSTPMGRLRESSLNPSALGIGSSELASPFSPGFNEDAGPNAESNGFLRDPMGPLAFLANTQRSLALEFVSISLREDLAALAETSAELDRLHAELAAMEAQRDARRAKLPAYQTALDAALIALQEEKMELIAMREKVFLSDMHAKDEVARAGQSADMALRTARRGWCRLWVDC